MLKYVELKVVTFKAILKIVAFCTGKISERTLAIYVCSSGSSLSGILLQLSNLHYQWIGGIDEYCAIFLSNSA